jgi:hypothetical protein
MARAFARPVRERVRGSLRAIPGAQVAW